MLIVDKIYKAYHHKPILDGVSFSVNEGETVGIIGENGAGKTSLLRILAKISAPDRGEIKVNDSSIITGGDHTRSKILYLGHYPSMYPVLSAKENLELVANLYGNSIGNDKISSVLKEVGLGKYSWDSIRYFSRGMLQRLALAKALIVPWDLLLLDEPTTGLDENGMQLLEEFLNRKRKEKKTLVIVSHQVDWLKQFCSRLLTLHKGVIVDRGEG